jgi:hypothetical protein|tara:strand:- start:1835 stop:2452 length:618 start_codon:yes stop_codon:yes gene_type:complete
MSVSSLTKFTVPIDGDQSAASQGLLMPKLKYRFRASFENFGISSPRTEMTKQVMNITRPAVTFEESMIEIYNSKVYLAGKHTWDPITVNLRDDVNGGVTKLCGEQIQRQFDFMEQSSASSGIDYKFITRFELLDGGNGANAASVLETWELYGCFVQNINYNDLDYASQEPVQITMSIRFDNAVQTPLGDGIGSTVARTLGQTITG